MVKTRNQYVPVILDTGSTISLIDIELTKTLQLPISTWTGLPVIAANKSPLPIHGVVIFSFSIG
jgi:hypothetical protein